MTLEDFKGWTEGKSCKEERETCFQNFELSHHMLKVQENGTKDEILQCQRLL